MNQYIVKAYAKINLGLDVIKKLPNGYHQVKMVMQAIDLWDELTLEKAADGIVLTTDAGELPTDENNLIYKAAKLMRDTYSLKEGVKIHLQKNIPIAAGMAGGSTDAAAAMMGINRLFSLGIPHRELMRISATIGADVPFCILGGTALAEGIGEQLTPLPPVPPCHVLVAKPDISVSTKYVYEHLDSAGIQRHPDIDGMITAIREGSLQGVLSRMENVLESVTVPAYPIIESIKENMLELGAAASLMSGSGPTVFGIFTEGAAAEYAFRRLKAEGLAKQVFLTAPLNISEELPRGSSGIS
ncbi:MAG: 4-(cytidine 5'-diphospho)-2-C-methyl-D-erythritol kinase [Acetatifactor sp.]|nr:4-(cytidine 5'-diphospho)-2-C-methyl-D-erythritol kinase [Acetatifactor sp.]